MLDKIIYSIREPTYSHNTVHTTMEDFQRSKEGVPVIVCIGACGSGKSTLLNRMCGLRMIQSEAPDFSIKWVDARGVPREPYFVSAVSGESVTTNVSFANANFCGDIDKPVILVDTPGHDIPEMEQLDEEGARESLQMMAADFHDKLKAIGRIDCLIVLHNDVYSNRMNAATYSMLQMIHEKFSNVSLLSVDRSAQTDDRSAQIGHSVEMANSVDSNLSKISIWDNVIVCYSKCNRNTNSWKNELNIKFLQMRKEIKSKLFAKSNDADAKLKDAVQNSDQHICAIESLKIITIGGLDGEPTADSPLNGDLYVVWDMIRNMKTLDTRNLMPFNSSFAKFESLIRERNEIEARYLALQSYPGVVIRFVAMFFGLSLRSKLLPAPLNLLLLDFKGPYDEILATGLMCHSIGMQRVIYSCEHIWGMISGTDLMGATSGLQFGNTVRNTIGGGASIVDSCATSVSSMIGSVSSASTSSASTASSASSRSDYQMRPPQQIKVSKKTN